MLAYQAEFGKLHVTKKKNLFNLRFAAMCVLGFYGFLRFSEIVNLRRSDLKFVDNYIELFIEKSKTDKYRQGAKVFISVEGKNSGIKICLFNYFSLAGIAEESCDFIFRHIIRMRSGFKLDKKRRLTYCRAREVLLDRLTDMGLDKKLFGLHSLRSGGATAAASNASVCDTYYETWSLGNRKI